MIYFHQFKSPLKQLAAQPPSDERFHDTQNYSKIKLQGLSDITTEEQGCIHEELLAGKFTRGETSDRHKIKLSVVYRMSVDAKRESRRLKKREAKQVQKDARRQAAEAAI